MRYAIVIEAAGATAEAAEQAIREAIEFHREGLRDDGEPIPPTWGRVEYVEVAARVAP